VDILDNMSRKETGKKNLNLLGLDGLLRKWNFF
jgi:hypothetical protein